jgi:hypothetical protein
MHICETLKLQSSDDALIVVAKVKTFTTIDRDTHSMRNQQRLGFLLTAKDVSHVATKNISVAFSTNAKAVQAFGIDTKKHVWSFKYMVDTASGVQLV